MNPEVTIAYWLWLIESTGLCPFHQYVMFHGEYGCINCGKKENGEDHPAGKNLLRDWHYKEYLRRVYG